MKNIALALFAIAGVGAAFVFGIEQGRILEREKATDPYYPQQVISFFDPQRCSGDVITVLSPARSSLLKEGADWSASADAVHAALVRVGVPAVLHGDKIETPKGFRVMTTDATCLVILDAPFKD